MSAENIIFQAVDVITSAREADGSYKGNSHHLSQEITAAILKALQDKHLLVEGGKCEKPKPKEEKYDPWNR